MARDVALPADGRGGPPSDAPADDAAAGAGPGDADSGEVTAGARSSGDQHSRRHVLSRAVREFFADDCWDRAAALTFFGVLSISPTVVALALLLAVLGQREAGPEAVLDVVRQLTVDDDALDSGADLVLGALRPEASGWTIVVSVLTGLWMAAGYVGAFGRAINRIYGVDEGRPLWKLQLAHLLTTLMLGVFGTMVILMLVVSGPVAHAIGEALGLGTLSVQVWETAKWPVLVLAAVVAVAVLYYAAPNVAHPRFRWISPGAVVGLGIAAIASYAFALFVTAFGRFDITYGAALASIVAFFVWMWIVNMSLLFGAEMDAELERTRQLRAGIEADDTLQVAPRDTRASERAWTKRRQDIARARSLRARHGWVEVEDDDVARPTEPRP